MSNHHILGHKEETIVMCPQFQFLTDFLSVHSPKAPPTDEQIMDFIEKRLAPFRNPSAQQNGGHGATPLTEETQISEDTDCSIPEPSNAIHLPTTSFSNEENVQRQSHNISTEQHTARRGQRLIKDCSTTRKPNAALTLKPTVTRDCATVASDTHLTGTLRSVVKHSQHAHKNEFLMESTCIGNDMLVRKHLDVLPNAAGIKNGIVALHYSLTTLKELIASLENAETVAKVDNFSEVILQQYWNKDLGNVRLFTSTEYPQIMRNVAATCRKNEDASPVVLAAVAGMSPDSPSDKSVSDGLLTCSSVNLDDTDKMPGLCWTPKSINNQKKEEMGPETAEAELQLDSLKCVTNTPVGKTQSMSVVFEHNILKHKTLDAENANAKLGQRTEQPQHLQIVCEDVTTWSKIKMGKNVDFDEFPDQTAPSVNYLKCPKYEDITDDQGVSHEVPNQPCVSPYEDISEDEEPQIKNIIIEARSLTRVPANNNETSNLENEGPGNEDDDDDDDDGDQNKWLVIPVSVEDIDFEPENPDEEQEDLELIVLHPEKAAGAGRWNATRPAQCSVCQPDSDAALTVGPSQIEVFDTFDSFVKAKSKQLGFCKSTPPDELHSNTKPPNAQDIKEADSEPEDSCETDDSCDYSSATVGNRLTVDRRLLKGVSVPAPSDHFLFERKGRTRSHKCKEVLDSRKGSRPKASETNDVIVLYSDTDDESDQMRNTSLFLSSEDGGSPCHGSSLPFESNFGFDQVKRSTNGPNVSAQQIIINLDSDTDSSGSVNGQLTEDKEHIKQGTNRPRKAKKTVFHGLGKVVKKDGVCKKKPSVERTVSDGDSSTSFAVQNKLATKMANHHTHSESPQKITSKKLSKDSSSRLPQSESKQASPDDPVIGRLFVVASSQCGSHLKLSKEPKKRPDEEQRKNKKHRKTKFASGRYNNHTANKPPASVTKPKPACRQMSNQERLSLSISNSTVASGQFPGVRQRSASEGLNRPVAASAPSSVSKQSTSVPTQQLSSSKLKHSPLFSSASTLERPKALTKDLPSSTTTQPFTKKRLRNEWRDSFVPTKLDRRPSSGTEKPLRNKSCDSSGQPRPGLSHQSRQMSPRHRHVNKSATPLMKRTKQEAIQRTKDINRTMPSGPSNIVGKHYKWAEEQKPAKVASSWKRKRL